MQPVFARIFDDENAMRLWFANFIMYSAALTVAGCYVPFTDIGAAVMKMLADTRGIEIDESDKKERTEKLQHSNQGITKTQRGEEQPADKDRAQTAEHAARGKSSPSRESTGKIGRTEAARSGQSTKSDD